MFRAEMELTFRKTKTWPSDWPQDGIGRGVKTLIPVFNFDEYSFMGGIEKELEEVFLFEQTYILYVNFPTITSCLYKELKDNILVDAPVDCYFGSSKIGQARLLECNYYESYDIVDEKVIIKN